MILKYFGYNAFLIDDGEVKIAIDPGMDLWLFRLRTLVPKKEWEALTHVLVTHGDPDHFAYAPSIAKQAGATVICAEPLMVDFLAQNVKNVHRLDVGATVTVEALSIKGLPAKHGPLPLKLLAGLVNVRNEVAQGTHGGKRVFLGGVRIFSSGSDMHVYSRGTVKLLFGLLRLEKENVDFARGSIGFKVTLGKRTVVNLGDTVFQEGWEGLKPDLLMIPIGGRVARNTMDEKEALRAVRLIEPKCVVPCHYNCDFLWQRNINPADEIKFKRDVEALGIACHTLKPGEEVVL